jgi:PAS domain S-box-containing protein
MKKVLSVDNNPVMLKYMSNLLIKEGHDVITAEDGLSALDVLETYTPDIMFLDLVMPNIDGRTLCRVIRRMERFKNTPVIILSATAAEESLNVEEIGATLCIAKGPFNLMKPHILSALELSAHGAFQDPDEKPIGHQDIHPRGVTRELLSVKQHFEIVLERMSEGLAEITREGRIIYTNSAALSLLQLPLEKLMGNHFKDLFNPEDRPKIQGHQKKSNDNPQADEKIGPFTLNGRLINLVFLPITGEKPSSLIILTDVTEHLEAQRALQAEHDRLLHALSEVKTLSGLLPICASCKKIRDDKGYWNQIESYIRDHSEADFSHSICPVCAKKLYPEYFKD